MNGNSLLMDTNIALYLLKGDTTIADLLNGWYWDIVRLPKSIAMQT